VRQQELGVTPSGAGLADQIGDRYADVLEQHLVQRVPLVQRPHRAADDAGRSHIDQQEGDALLRFGLRVGADQSKNPVRVVGFRGPDLVAVHHEVVPIALGARAQ
jgi:hypothetical protein